MAGGGPGAQEEIKLTQYKPRGGGVEDSGDNS